MDSSVQRFNWFKRVFHQRLGIRLRHVALQAEVATGRDLAQGHAVTGLEVSRADLGAFMALAFLKL